MNVEVQVKLSIEHRFKRSIRYNFSEKDDVIEDVYAEHAKKYEFADITWYPSRHTVVYRYDSRVPLNASGDGLNDFIGFQPNSIVISESVRAAGICSIFFTSYKFQKSTIFMLFFYYLYKLYNLLSC